MDIPYGFKHELDPDLLALDRIEALVRRAPEGLATVQLADPGRERQGEPTVTKLEGTLAEDVLERQLHVHLEQLHEWAPEYAQARAAVLEAAGIDPAERHFVDSTVIRVFSPDAPVSLHADPETQINCGFGGRSVWHVYTPSGLSQQENESLLHGGHFLPWREMQHFESYDLHLGDGFAAPPRWPHWIEHPGPDPALSFEVGYFTAEDIRNRKVWDVNWLLRKARLQPRPPGEDRSKDRTKQRVFDAISVVTRRGSEFRGV
ncbi:MAG TPA: hypothetical protein VEH79_04275 [Gaiellaceae bacterium]|nr:hypothetical protein [Gaiellaceae bacterium]